ncbi:hypothetical protein Chor_010765 [Crotalus horridus]
MEGSFWKTLLVLAVCGTPSSLAHRPLSYGEALELADPNSEGSQQLNFTLKETACQVEEERSLEECGFQEDGVSKGCSSWVEERDAQAGTSPNGVKRFKKFFKKVKKSVKKRVKKFFKKPKVIGVSIPF